MKLTPDKPIALQKRVKDNGTGIYRVAEQVQLLCSAGEAGSRMKSQAAAVGYAIDVTVQLWRSEYQSDRFTHAVLDGNEYCIADELPGRNDLFIRLALTKDVG